MQDYRQCMRCCGAVCWLVCWPPCPSIIASKMAFMPPSEATYRIYNGSLSINENVLFGQRGGGWRVFEPQVPLHVVTDIVTRRGSRLVGFYLQQADSDYCIVFSHGNAVDLGIMAIPMAMLCANLNISVFIYDYSGYGLSTGKLREANLYADIEAAVETVKTQYHVPAEQIILYGQSIGTVPTVDYASKHPEVAAVILHSPLASGLRVLRPTLKYTWCCDPFPSIKKIHRIEVPILIVHGTSDEVIDYSHSKALHARCPSAKYLTIEGAGHNDMEEMEEFQAGLAEFLSEIRHGEAEIHTQPTTSSD